ncbi:PAAR domain-containing protein [Endozoicomonas arenosclerae]|uniref:PAAR domain-containing protein n=1 Tax=Endozoicomonas arenosclerae TaxID=1633495 RepID=UPI000B08CA0A|nr:PAAR domain-containing protein [Endozoicomonas arenosclerae]
MKNELETSLETLLILIRWLLRYLDGLKPLLHQDSDFNQQYERLTESSKTIEDSTLLAMLQHYQASHLAMQQSTRLLSDNIRSLLEIAQQLHLQYSEAGQTPSTDSFQTAKAYRLKEKESFQHLVIGMQRLQSESEPDLFEKRRIAAKNLQTLLRECHTSGNDQELYEVISNQKPFIDLRDPTFSSIRTRSQDLIQTFGAFTKAVPDSLKPVSDISDSERIANQSIESRLPLLLNQLTRTVSAISSPSHSGLNDSLTALSNPLREITKETQSSSTVKASESNSLLESKQQTLQSFRELTHQIDQYALIQSEIPIELSFTATQFVHSFSAASPHLSQTFLDKNNQALMHQAMILEQNASSGIKLIKPLITELLAHLERLIKDQKTQQDPSLEASLAPAHGVLKQLSSMIQELNVLQSSSECTQAKNLSQQILQQGEGIKALTSNYVTGPLTSFQRKSNLPDSKTELAFDSSGSLLHSPQHLEALQNDLINNVSSLVSKDYRSQVKRILTTLSGVSGLVVNHLVSPQETNLQLEKRRQVATDQLKQLIDKPESAPKRTFLKQLFSQSVDLGFQFIADQVDPAGSDEEPSPGRQLVGSAGNLFKTVVHHTASDFIDRVKEKYPESKQVFNITAKGVQAAVDMLSDEDAQALIKTGKQLVENLVDPEAHNKIDVSKALSHATGLGLKLADKVINTQTFESLNQSLGVSDAIKGLQNLQKDGTLDYVTRRLLSQGPIDTPKARAEVIRKTIKEDPMVSTGDKDTGAQLKLEPKKHSISATLKNLKNLGKKVTTTVLDKVSELNPSVAPRLNTVKQILNSVDQSGFIDFTIDALTGQKATAQSFQGSATPPSFQPATPDFPAGPVGLPAARATDMHICSMQNPPPVSAPHVGGPLLPLPTNVLIGNLPAATLGQPCICVGPPDSVIMGSFTVLINNKPAVRMGDSTAHGGTVIFGWPTVLIG